MKRTILAATAAVLIAAPALASSEDFKLDVTFSRTALNAPATAAAEYDRIAEQVSEACTVEHSGFRLSRVVYADHANRLCTQRTMSRVVRQIDHPQLTEIHADRRAGS